MKKSTMSGIIALLVAGLLALTAGIGSSWFTNGNIKTWFNSWGKGKQEIVQPDNLDTPDGNNGGNTASAGNGGAIISDIQNNGGISLLSAEIPVEAYAANGISTQAETAYSLNATITPATADNRSVEWTVTEPSGTLNVADYITLNANGLTATVACKQAFDYQFIVTVKSLDNPEAKATCTLDYVERVTGVTVNMPSLTSTIGNVTYSVQSSKYTIKADVAVTFSNFIINLAFINAVVDYELQLEEEDYIVLHPKYTNELVKYTSTGVEFLKFYDVPSLRTFGNRIDSLMSCFIAFTGQRMDDMPAGSLISAFRNVCYDYMLGYVNFTVSSTYGGKTYSSVSEKIAIRIDGSALHIPVSSLKLDNGSIVF